MLVSLLLALPAFASWNESFDRDTIEAVHQSTSGDLVAIAIGDEGDRAAAAICAVAPGCKVKVLPSAKGKMSDADLIKAHGSARTWVIRGLAGVDDAVVASHYQGGNRKARMLVERGEMIVHSAQIQQLEDRVAQLQRDLESARRAPPRGAAAPIDHETERAAGDLLKEANGHFENNEFDKAREKLDELKAKFPQTRATRAAKRIEDELAVIGTPVEEIEVDTWFQGELDIDDHDVTLFVFWEVWCPHCKREVPKLEQTYQKYKGRMGMIGLTKQTRSISDSQVTGFIADNDVTYPIARESGQTMSDLFNVKGIPASAVVKNGEVIWRGHPARLTDAMLDGWLE